jgi:type I restriction enzyme S subunit
VSEDWRQSTWGAEISLEYGKAIRGYQHAVAPYRVFGSNGPIGWTESALAAGPGVILGRKGAYRGVQFSTEPFFVIDTAYFVKPKTELDMRWLYYAIIHHKLGEIDDGSPIPSTTRAAVYVRDVDVPSLPEQRAIAATLGALDDKIDLNRRMNETLEAMARALFRDWFFDFGPTRAKMAGTAPYLSPDLWFLFPDSLDDAGKPEGWKIFNLGQIAEHHTKTLTPAKMAELEVEHFSLPAYDKGQIPAIDHGASIKSNKTLVPAEAVLLSKLNPEIPRVWMPETHRRLQQVSSTEFLAYTAKAGAGRCLLFCLFSDQGFREMLHGMVTGTSKSHQRISPPSLLGREVITGAQEMFDVFEQLVAPFLKRVRENRAESRTLAQTRDLLLPRLMSGEVRVAEAARAMEEAAR